MNKMAFYLERKFGYAITVYGIFMTSVLIYKSTNIGTVTTFYRAANPFSFISLKKQDTQKVVNVAGRYFLENKFVLSRKIEEKSKKQTIYSTEEYDSSENSNEQTQNDKEGNIPSFMYTEIKKIVSFDNLRLPDCGETAKRTNFVYVKVHKCASDTIAAVGRRFAMDRNLSVVLPIKTRYLLGWPHQLQPYTYRPLKTRGFNIIVDHMVYNRTYLDTIMPKDTIYFTSLRELMSRLISAVDYFGVAECGFIPGNLTNAINKTDAFLQDMVTYDRRYKSVENVFLAKNCGCVPKGFSVVRNAMAFDLGFPTGFHLYEQDQSYNYKFILEWLKTMHMEMKVVIMTHKFDESMVLLKKYMCWSTKDILYKTLNNWKHPAASFKKNKVHAFQNWSNVDMLLFQMFSGLHDKRVHNLGEDFLNETEQFKQDLIKVRQFCMRVMMRFNMYRQIKKRVLVMPATKWETGYKISTHDCIMMHDRKHLRNKIKEEYDKTNNDTEVNVKPNPGYKWC